jgi:hypothetical protein
LPTGSVGGTGYPENEAVVIWGSGLAHNSFVEFEQMAIGYGHTTILSPNLRELLQSSVMQIEDVWIVRRRIADVKQDVVRQAALPTLLTRSRPRLAG